MQCALAVSNNSGQVFTAHAKNMHSAHENFFRFMEKNDCISLRIVVNFPKQKIRSFFQKICCLCCGRLPKRLCVAASESIVRNREADIV